MPALALAALQRQIAARELDPVYLFVGEDVTLVSRMLEAVENTVDQSDRPFAVDRFHAGEPGASPVDVVASARSLPMLGDRRIVLVRRAERWLKPKRAATASVEPDEGEGGEDPGGETADLGALEAYLAAPATFSTVVFAATEVDRSRRLTKRLLEHAQVVVFAGLAGVGPARQDGRLAPAEWLRGEMTRAGRAIEPDAARLLIGFAGGDITKLRGDLERLLLYVPAGTIAASDVAEIVSERVAEDDWALVNAIAAGEPARALIEVGHRLDRGDSPHQVLGQLRWWVSARLAPADPGRVKAALDALLRTDLALKSSGGEDRVLLERLVVELTGRAVRQEGWTGRRQRA